MNKIAILYICTGNYDVFWETFYKSSEKYFLTNSEKHYFVFTDSHKIYNQKNIRITKVHQKNLGWPYNTLMRFNMFKRIENQLKDFDYIFFLNDNILFVDKVTEDILPINEDLLVVKHPAFYNRNNLEFTYDRNEESTAYIEIGKGKYYVAGGFNGGKSKSFIKLINDLDKNINEDLKHNVIARWHDESYLNKYILDKNVKVLEPEYIYPELWDLPFNPKIIVREKRFWGGHEHLRSVKEKSIKEVVKSIFTKISK